MQNRTSKYTPLFLRLALATALLSAVADRLGFWPEAASNWGNMKQFTAYTAQITSFLPSGMETANAWLATLAETVLGLLLILGFKTRWTAFGSGLLLLIFAVSMTLTVGVKTTFDYSVCVGSAAAFLLAGKEQFYFSLDQLISQKSSTE